MEVNIIFWQGIEFKSFTTLNYISLLFQDLYHIAPPIPFTSLEKTNLFYFNESILIYHEKGYDSMTEKKDKYNVQMISIEKIESNPDQSRIYIDEDRLKDLMNSIKKNGILQPILVRSDDKRTVLVAGQRRLEAAKRLQLDQVPVFFISDDPLEISLIENLQREDLHPIDESEGLFKLMEKREKENGECTQQELAAIVGKKQNTVSEILTLMKIPDDIRDECRKEAVWTRKNLLNIAKLKKEETMRKAYQKMKKDFSSAEKKKKESPKMNVEEKKSVAFIRKIDTLDKSLGKLKVEKIREERKKEITDKLNELMKSIDEAMKMISG